MAALGSHTDIDYGVTFQIADRELIFLVQDGTSAQNENACSIIYDKYHQHLWHYIRKQTNGDEDANEISCNTWLTVLEKLPTFEWRKETQSENPLKSWIFSIAKRKTLEYFRKEVAHEYLDEFILAKLGADTALSYTLFQKIDEDRSGLKAQANRRLRKAIETLKKVDQQIITLYYYKEMNFAEIGDVLKMKEGAVRTRHHRLLPRLQKYLQEGAL